MADSSARRLTLYRFPDGPWPWLIMADALSDRAQLDAEQGRFDVAGERAALARYCRRMAEKEQQHGSTSTEG